MKELIARATLVTPEMAEAWLNLSNGNRRDNKERIRQYAKAMLSGAFKLSNDVICFNEDGVLKNGHHRLKACVQSGKPFNVFVAYDMPNDCVFDRGFNRTAGDALYMAEIIPLEYSSGDFTAITRRYFDIKYGTRSPADFEIGLFENRHGETMKQAIRISGLGSSKGICKRVSIQTAFFAALNAGVDASTLTGFAKVANSGYMDDSTQSAAILLRKVVETYPPRSAGELNALCALAQLAIKDFTNGTPRRRMYRDLYFPYIPNAQLDGKSLSWVLKQWKT